MLDVQQLDSLLNLAILFGKAVDTTSQTARRRLRIVKRKAPTGEEIAGRLKRATGLEWPTPGSYKQVGGSVTP